jgi:hypothetical protein
MEPTLIEDAGHWRRRAEEAREVAAQLDDEAKKTMPEIAQSYDRLAELAEMEQSRPRQSRQ